MDVTVSLFDAFSHVNTLESHEVNKYLDTLKQESPEIHQQLLALLSKNDQTGYFTNLIGNTIQTTSDDPYALVGLSIRDYTLTEVLGCGGMGAVYKAIITKGSFNKVFAIKIIYSHMNNILGEQGVMHEATLMSFLTHPNIGEVIDVGNTEGHRYIVMEYIDGIDIVSYLTTQDISNDSFYSILLSVCNAAHFAHQTTIVHADLKPSNILVNRDGQPKVIDFGIAQLLKTDAISNSEYCQTTIRGLTKKYASPELFEGKPIGTLSDVYSLGILFIECLELYLGSPSTAHQKMPPNDVKELKWLFSQASQTNAENRTSSALELARQIQRVQQGHVVEAYQANWFYRLKKLVFKRKPFLFIALFFTFTSLSALFLNIIMSNIEIKAQKIQSDIVADSLASILTISDPNKRNGEAIYAEDLLSQGISYLEHEQLNPVTHARISIAIADSYMGMNQFSKAQAIYLDVIKALDVKEKSVLLYKSAGQMLNIAEHASIPEQAIDILKPLASQIFTQMPEHIEQARFYVNFLRNQQLLKTGSYKGDFSVREQEVLKYMVNNFQEQMEASEVVNVAFDLAVNLFYGLPSGEYHTYFQLNKQDSNRLLILNEAYQLLQRALVIAEAQIKEATLIAKLNIWLARIEGELDQADTANQKLDQALKTYQKVLGENHRDTRYAQVIGMLVNYYVDPKKALQFTQTIYNNIKKEQGFTLAEQTRFGHYLLDMLAINGDVYHFTELYHELTEPLLSATKPIDLFLINQYTLIVKSYLYTLNSAPSHAEQLINVFSNQLPHITIAPIKIRAEELIEKLKLLSERAKIQSVLADDYSFYAKPLGHQSTHVNKYELNLDLLLHANYYLQHGEIDKAATLFSNINFSWSVPEQSYSIMLFRYRLLQAWLVVEQHESNSIDALSNIIEKLQAQLTLYQLKDNNVLYAETLLLKAKLAQLKGLFIDAEQYARDSEKVMIHHYTKPNNYFRKLEEIKQQVSQYGRL